MTLTDEEVARWGMTREYIEDSSYRQVIERQLRLCHGGLANEAYERMYEASLFRDEGMAKTIIDYLSRAAEPRTSPGAAPIISYTGSGHIQYQLPVPSRVQRRANRPLKQTTVYLAALDPASPEEVTTLLQEAIADYVWLTPIGTHGPPKRCR
jgi:uncharacterized iron-regulated protein